MVNVVYMEKHPTALILSERRVNFTFRKLNLYTHATELQAHG